MQEGKDGNVQFWQVRPQNSLLLSKIYVDLTERLEQAEYYQSFMMHNLQHYTTTFWGDYNKEAQPGMSPLRYTTEILIKRLQWGRRRKWPKPVQSCVIFQCTAMTVEENLSKVGLFQLDKEGTQQWRTVDLVVTSNSWGTCWLSSIGRSELTFQMVTLRHWSSQQYPYCYSVFNVLPFCSFPYMQNSIYTSFSKNGFEHLTFPSNKAGGLMNITKPSLRYNLLWVSSR